MKESRSRRHLKQVAGRALVWAAAVIAFALLCDRIVYSVLFPLYDRRSTLAEMGEPVDSFIVGSSQTRWAVDAAVVAKESGLSFAAFAPPGANVELRAAMVEDYLARFPGRPKVVVFEMHPLSFHPTRYPDDAYKTLLGYTPRGILVPYLAKRYAGDPVFPAGRVFHSLTLNGEFYFLGAAVVDLPVRMVRPVSEMPAEPDLPLDVRVAQWRKYYEEIQLTAEVDALKVEAFRAFLKAAEESRIPVILLDMPTYRLNAQLDQDLDRVRSVMFRDLPSNVQYVRLEGDAFEKDASFFYDAAHLNQKGRAVFSRDLARFIRERK